MATTKKQSETKPEKKAGSAPVMTWRRRGVKVAVFENETENSERKTKFFKVSLQRIYREGEEWKTTTSLSRDDIPVARHLLQQAWAWIMEQEAMPSQEESDQGSK